MEGVQGVVDCGALGGGTGRGGVRGHDVFTHTHIYICTLMVLHHFSQ